MPTITDPVLAWLAIAAIFINGVAVGTAFRGVPGRAGRIPRFLTPFSVAMMFATMLMDCSLATRLASAGFVMASAIWFLYASARTQQRIGAG